MGNKTYAYKQGADVAIVVLDLVDNQPTLKLLRAYSKDTASEGEIASQDIIDEYLRFAKPFVGNVGPGLSKALENAVVCAMFDAFVGGAITFGKKP